MKRKIETSLLFGKRLRAFREAKNLSVEEVAKSVKVATSTYREWENGRAITGEPYVELSKALGVSVYQLLGLEDSTKERVLNHIQVLESQLNKLKLEL